MNESVVLYQCPDCGYIVEVVNPGSPELICSGEAFGPTHLLGQGLFVNSDRVLHGLPLGCNILRECKVVMLESKPGKAQSDRYCAFVRGFLFCFCS